MVKILLTTIMVLTSMVQMNQQASESFDEQYYLYVGAYTQNDSEGIYLYQFDATDGDLTYISTVKGVKNPSYLAINSRKNVLIAVNEISEFEGEKSGAITSFTINPVNGSLTEVSQVSSGGGSPCYVSVNKGATQVYVANYGGGNISVFPLLSNGRLQPFSDLKQHVGSGPDQNRQRSPRAHSIELSPNENFALAADLGTDKVITYAINVKKGVLNPVSELKMTPGAGPRHIAFHNNKKFVFVINELNSTITSCLFDAKTGKLSSIQSVNTLPPGFTENNYCADIHISKDGRFLYGSNRGHDSIVIFEIDTKSGELSYVDHHAVKGKFPRNFMIDPTGKFLLVANQNSNNIVVFKIDQETGKLRANGVEIAVSKPVCLKMKPMK